MSTTCWFIIRFLLLLFFDHERGKDTVGSQGMHEFELFMYQRLHSSCFKLSTALSRMGLRSYDRPARASLLLDDNRIR